ncbi:cobalt ECF transporter T component CbiQ [Bacillus massiliigorillae]|uniref:cobalt ECF transporter T component CbiQ n=1 Tax=Bacillus massiliigorillae TaxID=1243664 RepID=UPI0003A5D1B4|nr:cobalt ECF transporter T component CbiQ [Bacillus massiliigorillae]
MLLIDKYAYFNRLSETHPVEKMVFSLTLMIFSLAVKNVLVSLITFIVMSAFTIFAAKIPFTYYVKLLLLPAMFLLSGLVTLLLSFADFHSVTMETIWELQVGKWVIFITNDSVQRAATLFFTVLGSISCLYFLTLTTPLTTIFDILRKLKVPKLLIELIELTYRFIFVFLDTSLEIFRSQHARLGYFTIRQGIQSLGLLISTLFVQVFRRANELNIAMHARGYHEDLNFLQATYHYSTRNWVIIISIFTAIAMVYYEFGGII